MLFTPRRPITENVALGMRYTHTVHECTALRCTLWESLRAGRVLRGTLSSCFAMEKSCRQKSRKGFPPPVFKSRTPLLNSGTGYTLSGKLLDPNSAAAKSMLRNISYGRTLALTFPKDTCAEQRTLPPKTFSRLLCQQHHAITACKKDPSPAATLPRRQDDAQSATQTSFSSRGSRRVDARAQTTPTRSHPSRPGLNASERPGRPQRLLPRIPW